MIQDDPGTFWVRLADSVNHTKYPVVILTTDHQIKTGEIVPLRVDQLVVFCPPKESPSTSFARSNKNIQTLSKTGNHAPNTSPGPLGPLRKCLGWSQWQSGRCDARLQTVCSPPWTIGMADAPCNTPFWPPKKTRVFTHKQSKIWVYPSTNHNLLMVSYAFPLGIKTNGLVPRFVGYNLPGLDKRLCCSYKNGT